MLERLREMNEAELWFVARDAGEAAEALDTIVRAADGCAAAKAAEKALRYLDEMNEAMNELRRRGYRPEVA